MELFRIVVGLPIMKRSLLLGPIVFAAVVTGLALPAEAHVHANPNVVKPGASATVGFGVEHGCGTSPTISVAIKAPAGVTKLAAVPLKGWKTAVAGSVVTFSGGNLPTKKSAEFSISFMAPTKEGDLSFPVVQTCVKGVNSWIQAPLVNGAEPDYPAPTLKVSATAKPTHEH